MWEEEVAEAVFGAAPSFGCADEARHSVLVEGVEAVALRGDGEAGDLDLLAGVWVEVLVFEFEDRFLAEVAVVGVEAPERLDECLADLGVAERAHCFAPVGESVWTAGAGDQAACCR